MKPIQKITGVVLVLSLGAAGYGLWRTAKPGKAPVPMSRASQGPFVDQSPLQTAQQLAPLADTPEERPLAQEALRVGDHEVDLAFATALREVAQHPPALSAEAKEIQARLQKSQKLFDSDKAQVDALTAAEVKASGSRKDALDEQLEVVKAQVELDQDEVDDAKQDLMAAGGDPEGRIQAMVQAHEAGSHTTAAAQTGGSAAPTEERGLIHRGERWLALHKKQLQLWRAKHEAEAAAAALAERHNELDTKVEAAKSASPALMHHSKKIKDPAAAAAPTSRTSDESAALVTKTIQIATDQKTLAAFDKRMDDEKELADIYGKWIDVAAAQQRTVLNRALWGIAIILGICLVAMFVDGWVATLLGRVSLDRRQIETLRAVTQVSLQVAGLLFILLVIFGPPPNLGTFLGLAGAGLTVALKDFIVGFIGWFVLMGKNGMRLGDWVEINGVTGEVVELGMFHTVLLETGNWTDSGHPTGRRVTFTNSFAIEGHYFNFSTSGQWLWDELQVVLPSGQNPYPIVDAIKKKVLEATADTGKKAEQEWRSAARSTDVSALSAAPAINVKPVIGGTEIAVRYITSAHERYQLRSKLNQILVDLLGPQAQTAVAEVAPAPGKA
jgi:small-conductance mechanosensitive channel